MSQGVKILNILTLNGWVAYTEGEKGYSVLNMDNCYIIQYF